MWFANSTQFCLHIPPNITSTVYLLLLFYVQYNIFKYTCKNPIYEVTLMGYIKSRETTDLLQQNQYSTQYSIQYTNINICSRTLQPIPDSLWGKPLISWEGTVASYIAVRSRMYVLFLLEWPGFAVTNSNTH